MKQFTSSPIQSVHITNPTAYPWRTEEQVYLHLWYNPEARESLFIKAELARESDLDFVFISHPLLKFPFTFFPELTDDQFLFFINIRLKFCTNPERICF